MRNLSALPLLGLLFAVSLPTELGAQPDLTRLVLSSPLIVRGTIVGIESPTLPLPPPKGQLVRIRVEETLRGATTIGDFTGQEIVVGRATESDRKSGIFFVRPIAYGKTLAAEEVGELDAPADTKALAAQIAEIEKQDADNGLAARLKSAEAVVLGRVLAVRPLRESEGGPSEHDPDWAVAKVLVLRTLGGQPKVGKCDRGNCVEIAFARSDDIRWFRSPKLVVGQADVLLLRPADPTLLRRGEEPPAAYVLVDPRDRQPAQESTRLRQLIGRTK